MSVCFTIPLEYQSDVCGLISKRDGAIDKVSISECHADVYAFVALNKMFGVHKDLSSLTRGSATFTMEYKCHSLASGELKSEILNCKKESSKSSRH